MEAFTLLKYWKTGAAPTPTPTPSSAAAAEDTAAILAAVRQNDNIETTDDDDEEGPFIDLEFAVPDEEEANDDSESDEDAHENPNEDDNHNNNKDESESESESEREFKFTLSPSTNEPSDDPSKIPEDLFFKGKLVLNDNSSEPNSKPPPQLFTASLLKSATKFQVFMSGLKKPKSSVSSSDKDSNASDSVPQNPKQQEPEPKQRKLFTVKLKVEEVPIVSLFTRDNSSKGGTANKPSQKQQKHQNTQETQSQSLSSSEEKQRFSKELMQKYLKMVKPLYIKVSRRYAEKLRLSGQLSMPPPPFPEKPAPAKVAAEKVQSEAEASESGGNNVKGQKQGNLHMPAGLRVVCKHLGKSRSASSSAPAPSPAAATVSSRRRDDSLLQQHDGIQSAILHCKKSFNASRECESSQLMPRSVSNPFKKISPESSSRKSTNEVEEKRL